MAVLFPYPYKGNPCIEHLREASRDWIFDHRRPMYGGVDNTGVSQSADNL